MNLHHLDLLESIFKNARWLSKKILCWSRYPSYYKPIRINWEFPSIASDNLKIEINKLISDKIGPIAKCDKIQFVSGLPKTRSGKIMRRILRKIAANELDNLGDISTLLNPDVVDEIIESSK